MIIGLALAIGLPRYKCFFGVSDEGFLSYGAERILQGEMPNRDFHSIQPPLSFYSLAVTYKIFGISLETNRRLGLLIYAAISLAIYFLSRQLTRPIFAFSGTLPALILGMPFFYFAPYAVWQGVITTLIAALIMMRAATRRSLKAAFLAGVVNALVMLCRQDQGFYLLIAVLGYIAALKLAKRTGAPKAAAGKLLGCWAAGIAVIILPLGIYWLVSGAMVPMIKQLIIFPFTTYTKTSGLSKIWHSQDVPLVQIIRAALFYLPILLAAITLIWLLVKIIRRRYYEEDSKVVFILFLSIVFYLQVLTRSDLEHILIVLPPFFVLGGWWLGMLSEGLSKALGWISSGTGEITVPARVSATVFVLLAAGAGSGWFMSHTKNIWMKPKCEPMRKVQLDRAGLYVQNWYADYLETVVGVIQGNAKQDRSILCLPYTPMLYFLSARRNPTKWNFIWPGDQSHEDHLALIRQAKSDPPAVVTVSSRPDLAPDIEYYAPVIVNYILSQYRLERTVANTKIYFPRKKTVIFDEQ